VIGIIYMIRNKLDGKIWIGQTRQTLNARLRSHRYLVKKNKHHHFYNAIRKYGWNNFDILTLAHANTIDELNELEIKFIDGYQSYDRRFGYNLDLGGNCQGPETSEKIRQTKKLQFLENPELKALLRKAHANYFDDPVNKEKHSKTIKQMYINDPSLGDKKRAKLDGYYKDNPNELSERAKARWLNPDFAKSTGNAISSGKTAWHPPVQNHEKFCPRCSKVKLKLDFHKSRRRKDGLECWCKTCRSEAQK
jgi:group I intron endonuclease